MLVSHDEGAVEALNPERVLILPDGVEDPEPRVPGAHLARMRSCTAPGAVQDRVLFLHVAVRPAGGFPLTRLDALRAVFGIPAPVAPLGADHIADEDEAHDGEENPLDRVRQVGPGSSDGAVSASGRVAGAGSSVTITP